MFKALCIDVLIPGIFRVPIEGKVTTISSAPTKRYYRVDEVAHYFSVCEQTIYRLIDMGDIKAIRLRGCIMVPAEELREIEERQRDDS